MVEDMLALLLVVGRMFLRLEHPIRAPGQGLCIESRRVCKIKNRGLADGLPCRFSVFLGFPVALEPVTALRANEIGRVFRVTEA